MKPSQALQAVVVSDDEENQLQAAAQEIGALTDPRDVYRRVFTNSQIEFNDIPLLTPSLLVFPKFPYGEAVVQDTTIEPDPFLRTWPNRPEIPNPNGSYLPHLSISYHESYWASFRTVCGGASWSSAFAPFGIVPQNVSQWMRQGSLDLEDGKDTYFSRFSLDMMRAVGIATSCAQMLIYASNPLRYLKDSLGQSMGTEYSDEKTIPSDAAASLAGLPTPPNEAMIYRDQSVLDSAESRQQAALAVLAKQGMTPAAILKHREDQFGKKEAPA